MNRQRRKAVKMAKRHKRGIWAPATHPYWLSQYQTSAPLSFEVFKAAMRSVYAKCSSGTDAPEHAIVNGELVNLALGTSEHDDAAIYHVGPDGITRLVDEPCEQRESK